MESKEQAQQSQKKNIRKALEQQNNSK